ncbi:hypothetical protein ACIF8T_21905 [Streptomyces sp. NPDC085946]|uniref:hypothetical protein n=1 Tax=Streptomyces sp. NPDC085946 TaxID=3365744 RepID=UPI0037CE4849
MTGRHRWTKTGLKHDNGKLQELLRAERTKSARLADELALHQRDRRLEKEQAAEQHQVDTREIARLKAALQAWEARWANAHPVSVPAPRDLRTGDDQPTVPQGTDVSALRAIYPVVPITERPAAPGATDPANLPAA